MELLLVFLVQAVKAVLHQETPVSLPPPRAAGRPPRRRPPPDRPFPRTLWGVGRPRAPPERELPVLLIPPRKTKSSARQSKPRGLRPFRIILLRKTPFFFGKTQRGNFDVFGGVAHRQENELTFARKRRFFVLGTFSAKPFFAQPARRLSAI